MIGVYLITNPNNRFYVGQAVDLKRREKEYSKLHCKNQPALYNSLKKYGWEKHSFQILELCNEENLNEIERKYQDLYNSVSRKHLNCKATKTKDKSGYYSEEAKKNCSIGAKNRKKIKFTEEHKKNIGLKSKGRIVREDVKNRISEGMKKVWEQRKLKQNG